MPTAEQILAGLKEIANTWRMVAIFWHFYFGVVAISLILGARPSRRISGILLALPLLSVSIGAWVTSNPFNGTICALIGVSLIHCSVRLPREGIQIAPLWTMIPGILMFMVGWVYPHFLDASSFLSYLYSAPIGLIPCPTLSILIGLALVLKSLGSRAVSLILGISGILYGAVGIVQLGVAIDWALLLGAILIVVLAFVEKHNIRTSDASGMSRRMTAWGIGLRLTGISLAYFALAAIVHLSNPGLFAITRTPHVVFPIAGTTLIAVGLVLWASAARKIDSAFSEGRLLTKGAYAIVRNPMYSGFIIFVSPGIALWFRSWPLLTAPLVACIVFKLLIKEEEKYLEGKFGQAYLDYEAKVNALVPFVRFSRSRKEQG